MSWCAIRVRGGGEGVRGERREARGEEKMSRSTARRDSHLHSRTHRCQGIHLGEAHGLAVHSLGLLDHDGGAGLALGPGRGRRVGWLGLRPAAGPETQGELLTCAPVKKGFKVHREH